MKTTYNTELQQLLNNIFIPSTPEDSKAMAMSLTQIYEQVINVLPAKWIDEADVYQALENLQFKMFSKQTENSEAPMELKYFLILKN